MTVRVPLRLAAIIVSVCPPLPCVAAEPTDAFAVVQGKSLTEGHVRLLALHRGLADDLLDRLRPSLQEQLIERQLVAIDLAARNMKVDRAMLDRHLAASRERLTANGQSPDEILKSLGLTQADVTADLTTTVLWKTLLKSSITSDRIRKAFRDNRSRFDGTQLRVRQILIKANPASDRDGSAALSKLAGIRSQILSGELTFAAAAERVSEAPSRDTGGDLGFIPFRGAMPADFTEHVFLLPAGRLSEPFTTAFGTHLCEITERMAGDLSLEDARSDVVLHLTRELWNTIVTKQRAAIVVERL